MSERDEKLKLALNKCVLAKIQGRQSDRDAMLDEAIAHIREALEGQPAQTEYITGIDGPPLEQPAQQCNPHPKAPHGFDRNASHNAGRYVCECEGWDAYEAGYQAGIEKSLELNSDPQPAQQQEPVAVVSGYYGGQCVIIPTNTSMLFNSGTALYTSPQPAQQQEPAAWRELCRRLYIELFHCDQQMTGTLDENGEPMWEQGATVRDVLADAKSALESSPPQRKPLTDEEIKKIWGSYFSRAIEFARAIEAAHGIKE